MTEPTREPSISDVIDAVRWTGDNMADVLKFAGHTNSSVNSFGDPCVKVGDQLEAVEIGQWAFRDMDERMLICSDGVFRLLSMLVLLAATAEEERDQFRERLHKVREIRDQIECSNCEHPAGLHDGGKCTAPAPFLVADRLCGCTWGGGDLVAQLDAVLDGDGEAKKP